METIKLKSWVLEMQNLLKPDQVYWCNGSEIEYQSLLESMVKDKKAIKLNPKLRPNSYLFFSDASDVARVEDRTFIASVKKEDAGPTNNWIDPKELKTTMLHLYDGAMKGRTMYVIPFVMGPIGSQVSKFGIQITDSPYVVVNMKLMTRMGEHVLKQIHKQNDFIPCLHSVGYPLNGNKDIDWPCAPIEEKYIAHFPEEKLIWSYGSGYGGNALLGKKCLGLRIASKLGYEQGFLAEHMLILKLTNPKGKSKYILGAFPSACGKTNLAMLMPQIDGWKVETVGDDIAWIFKNKEGKWMAINPESGFFGVAKGTNYETNFNAMKTIEKNTIFTNVALKENMDVFWDGKEDTPDTLISWKKHIWHKGDNGEPAHPNGRFTVSIKESPNVAKEFDDPNGVPISAILVGGRRENTIPLVTEALNYEHGIFMGSMISSEITAANITKDIGKVRRDPFAMLPFIGYHVGDYLTHWLEMKNGTKESDLPKFYYVNWFNKDENGKFIWPGYSENARVLKWIFERSDHEAKGIKTPIGILPDLNDFDLKGIQLNDDALNRLFNYDKSLWIKELDDLALYYEKLEKVPLSLWQQLNDLKKRLA